MPHIEPSISTPKGPCTQGTAGPCAMVVFGASGDLVSRKLLPSLAVLHRLGLLNENFYLIGCGRKVYSDEQFRRTATESIRHTAPETTGGEIESFTRRLYYQTGDYNDQAFYQRIKQRLAELDKIYRIDGEYIFYLAVPPELYSTIVEHLGRNAISCCGGKEGGGGCGKNMRLVVEKPFGSNLAGAIELNNRIGQCFDESQIYRIDHYLGKETVQNILMLRFANAIFEPLWNRNYISHVELTIAESIGVEHRAGYYEHSGALCDMFQNHILQMLCLVAMEPPASFDAGGIRDEKAKLLRCIRPVELKPWSASIVRGQYGPGRIGGAEVRGYRSEPGVAAESKIETYVAARLFVDNWRWKDVPFYVRTGKRLARRVTEIAIVFRRVPHWLFVSAGLEDIPANVLVLRIQPAEGISLSFQAKQPGSKLCISTLEMNFDYEDIFGVSMPEAYQRLLLDVMLGDCTLFSRQDSVELSWQLVMPVLNAWRSEGTPDMYPAGAESFPQADALTGADGRNWRKIGVE